MRRRWDGKYLNWNAISFVRININVRERKRGINRGSKILRVKIYFLEHLEKFDRIRNVKIKNLQLHLSPKLD